MKDIFAYNQYDMILESSSLLLETPISKLIESKVQKKDKP